MVDEQIILASERLRDDLSEFRKAIRSRCASATTQVRSDDLRTCAAQLAEKWLVEIATDHNVAVAIGSGVLADLNVHFQRILTFADHATTRSKYDAETRVILDRYTMDVLLPLKTSRGRPTQTRAPIDAQRIAIQSAFVGQSFLSVDARVNECVADTLEALGIKVVTGEQPKANTISDKVKQLIEEQSVFVGIFTRRDKIIRKPEWTTSAWVIDEKAYALGRRKPLVLLKEQGVGSIGGIQGDYEFLEFSRDELERLPIRLIQLFELINNGFRP